MFVALWCVYGQSWSITACLVISKLQWMYMLGNANELISQLRRSKILQLIDKSLEKYGQEPQLDSGEFFLAPNSQGTWRTTFSPIQYFTPVDHWSNQTAVFSKGPCQEMEVSAGRLSHPNTLSAISIKRSFILQNQGIQSAQFSSIKKILDQLPQPKESLMLVDLDTSLIVTHAHVPVG